MTRKSGMVVLAALATLAAAAARPSGPPSFAAEAGPPKGWIAFRSYRGDIELVSSDGRHHRRLMNTRLQEFTPAWSPDGRQLAFARDSTLSSNCSPTTTLCPTDLFLIKPNGKGLRRLSRNRPPVAYQSPTWSPSGEQIAFVRRHGKLWNAGDLFVMRSDGRGVRRLVAQALEPDWSPDGMQIAFTRPDRRYAAGTRGIFLISPHGGAVEELDKHPGVISPAWSPDGRRIVFSAVGGSYIMDVRTRRERKAPRCGDFDWSPDGRWLVGWCTEVAIMRPDGTGLRNLVGVGDQPEPDWQPSQSP